MTMGIFYKILDRLKEVNIIPKKFLLHCCGEPLLNPNLIRKIRILKEQFHESMVSFTSNFNYIDDQMMDELLTSGLDLLIISLNELSAEKYQRLMGLDLNTTLNNIEKLLIKRNKNNANLKIILSAVSNTTNMENIQNIQKFAMSKNIGIRIMKEGSWIKNDELLLQEDPNKIIGQHVFSRWQMIDHEICVLSNGDYAICCFDSEGVVGENII